MKAFFLALFSLLFLSSKTLAQNGPEQVVAGVDTIWTGGSSSPIFALNDSVIPLVAGNELTASIPSIVSLANVVKNGRVIAMGHDGFFNEDKFDNYTFFLNAIDWLDSSDRKSVVVTTGHGEWARVNDHLRDQLSARGYSVENVSGRIDEGVLDTAGVVIIGNAWGGFTQSELDVLQTYLEEGGGLFLMGLGWSWEPYNPGKTLADYPMNKIGAFSGVRWVNGGISDPTHQYQGQPIFLTFYPNLKHQTSAGARAFVDSVTATYASNLPAVLESNTELRIQYIASLKLLKTLAEEIALSEEQVEDIHQFYLNLITSYPGLFQKGRVYHSDTESSMAWIRELIHKSLQGVRPLTPTFKQEISVALNLTGIYHQLWDEFSVLLLDNSSLSESQKEFIYRYFSSIPSDIHNMRSISVRDFIGANPHQIDLGGSGGSVNIFEFEIGDYSENSFPEDVIPGFIDVFSVVVAHEVNHVVDAFYVGKNEERSARRNELIQHAGQTSMNYLRSMIDPGYFVNAPQEFFASISNQWFADSWKTLELGLARFDNGILHPINQALFFAEVYSVGTDSTFFYKIDSQGVLERSTIPVERDHLGRIVRLYVTDEEVYEFELDSNGDVVSYTTDLGTSTEFKPLPTAFALEQNYPNPFNPTTQIQFSLPQTTDVTLEVMNILGQPISVLVKSRMPAGLHTVSFDGSALSSGVYLYKLTTPGFTQTKVMNLIK